MRDDLVVGVYANVIDIFWGFGFADQELIKWFEDDMDFDHPMLCDLDVGQQQDLFFATGYAVGLGAALARDVHSIIKEAIES